MLAWSILGAVFFECCWWSTGGGYSCALPISLALCCYCYGRELVKLSILHSMARNIKLNVAFMCSEEKRSVLLILSYFVIKCGLTVTYPKGEESNGSPLSLLVFTVLFIFIFLVPLLFEVVCFLVKTLGRKATLYCACDSEVSQTAMHWKLCYKTLSMWKRSILVCAVLVLGSYLFDSEITALLRFLGKGDPCWPLLVPPNPDPAIPSSILNFYPWHTAFPKYQPNSLIKELILIGRELGEVCHLLPMLIGTYTLSQIFLPPKNSLIKSALFASIAGVVLGGVTSGSFKILFHRYRPNAYGNPYMWQGPGMATVNHLKFSKLDLSFPAGHTTVTSAVATSWYVLIMLDLHQLCLSPCINILILLSLYVHPILVLLSRVSECYHWTSDATFGVSCIINCECPYKFGV